MLPKTFRLKKKGEFKKIYSEGRSVATPYLVLFYKKRKEQEQSRIGFSTARAIGGNVERNRIKRRMREAARRNLLLISPGYDLIFLARHKIKGISFEDVEKNMVNLISRAGIIERREKR